MEDVTGPSADALKHLRLDVDKALSDGDSARAEQIARDAVQRMPESEDAWHLLISTLTAVGKSAEAIRCLEQFEGLAQSVPTRAVAARPSLRSTGRRRMPFAAAAALALAPFCWFLLHRGPAPLPAASLANWTASDSAQVNSLLQSANDDYENARFASSAAKCRQALTLCLNRADGGTVAQALAQYGQTQSAMGQLSGAAACLGKAIPLRQRLGQELCVAHLHHLLGGVQTRMGLFDAARASLEESEATRRRLGDRVGVVLCQRERAKLQLADGKPTVALLILSMAREEIAPLGKPDIDCDLRGETARVYLATGDVSAARAATEECLSYWRKQGHTRWIADLERQLADVEIHAGNAVRADQLLRDSVGRLQSVGDALGVAEAKLLLAQASYQQGRSEDAVQLAEQALVTFDRSGCTPDVTWARAILSRLHAP